MDGVLKRRVDGRAVHAVIVGGSGIVRDTGTVTYQRVDGAGVHPAVLRI